MALLDMLGLGQTTQGGAPGGSLAQLLGFTVAQPAQSGVAGAQPQRGGLLGMMGIDATDPNNAMKLQMITNGLRTQSGSAPTMFEGVQEAGANAQQVQLRRQAAEQEAADREEKKQNRLLTSAALKKVLPPNLWSLADADPESAMALYKQMQTTSGDQESFFGSPVPFKREDGTIGLGQLGNRGNFKEVDLPGELAPTTRQVDIGTDIVTQDIYGNELYRTPKGNEQAAFDTATGSGLGASNAENITAASSLASKLPGLRSVIGNLSELANTATYTQSGQLIDAGMRELGMEPSEAAVARAKYIAAVDNQVLPLLRDTFGAAFTQKEGEALRATLGDPDASPAEKQAILEAFIAQKERDVAAMQSRIPSHGGQSAPPDGVVDFTEFFGQ